MRMKVEKAMLEDAKELLNVQKKAFKKYVDKYGEFDSNPYHMSLHRMEFNIKYPYGKYYKIIDEDTNQIIGGIFGFEVDKKEVMQIGQFYLLEEYQAKGYGKEVLNFFLESNPQVEKFYLDTILQEAYNVDFYKHFGFEIIDYEEEHEGLTFVTLLKNKK